MEDLYQELCQFLPKNSCTMIEQQLVISMGAIFTVRRCERKNLLRIKLQTEFKCQNWLQPKNSITDYFKTRLNQLNDIKKVQQSLTNIFELFSIKAMINYDWLGPTLDFDFHDRKLCIGCYNNISLVRGEKITTFTISSPICYNKIIEAKLIRIVSEDIQITIYYLEREYIVAEQSAELFNLVCYIVNQQTELLVSRCL